MMMDDDEYLLKAGDVVVQALITPGQIVGLNLPDCFILIDAANIIVEAVLAPYGADFLDVEKSKLLN